MTKFCLDQCVKLTERAREIMCPMGAVSSEKDEKRENCEVGMEIFEIPMEEAMEPWSRLAHEDWDKKDLIAHMDRAMEELESFVQYYPSCHVLFSSKEKEQYAQCKTLLEFTLGCMRAVMKKCAVLESTNFPMLWEEYFRFLEKCLGLNLIDKFMEAASIGIFKLHSQVDRDMLEKVNHFLSTLGIWTVTLHEGDEMNYEYFQPLPYEEGNGTSDERLREKVFRVYRYAYVMGGGETPYLVYAGSAGVWKYQR